MNRSQRKLIFAVSMLIIVGLSLYFSFQFGEKSPVIASGTVELSSDLTAQAKDISTLFFIVRDANSPSPMPIGAARKIISKGPTGSFYEFILTKEWIQLMIENSSLPETMDIKARLDVDGAGGADTPGDIVGEVKGIISGTSGVHIKLDRVIN